MGDVADRLRPAFNSRTFRASTLFVSLLSDCGLILRKNQESEGGSTLFTIAVAVGVAVVAVAERDVQVPMLQDCSKDSSTNARPAQDHDRAAGTWQSAMKSAKISKLSTNLGPGRLK